MHHSPHMTSHLDMVLLMFADYVCLRSLVVSVVTLYAQARERFTNSRGTASCG